MNRLPSYAAVLCLALLVMTPARATNYGETTVQCPVCDEKVTAYEIGSYSTGGNQDTDLMNHTLGAEVIPLFPATCSRCYYSGYPSEFIELDEAKADPEDEADEGEAKKVELSDDQKKKLGATLKPRVKIERGMGPDKIPAWARYDLLAQTYAALGKRTSDVAFQYLRGSWAERIESTPSRALDEATAKALWQENAAGDERPEAYADYDAKHKERAGAANAKALLAAVAKRPDDRQTPELLEAIDGLRPHGDNEEILALLPAMKERLPPEVYGPYAKALEASIARERQHQARAAALFAKAAGEPPPPPDPDEGEDEDSRPGWGNVMTYLAGELHRRMGHADEARSFLERAAKAEEPDWVGPLASDQLKLVPAE